MTTARRKVDLPRARDGVLQALAALKGFATRLRPITERDYIGRVLEFARWDGSDLAKLSALEQLILIGGDHVDGKGNFIAPHEREHPSPITPRAPESAEFLRDMFRRHLTERLTKTSRWNFGEHVALGMVVMPAPSNTKTDGRLLGLYLPKDIFVAIEYSLYLLNERDRPYGDDLRKCELPTCGGFFLLDRNPKGGKPAKYHDDCRARLRAKSRHLKRHSTGVSQ